MDIIFRGRRTSVQDRFREYATAKLGKIGEYRRRVIFRRLGRARDFTCRFTVTDPIPFVLTGEAMDYEAAA